MNQVEQLENQLADMKELMERRDMAIRLSSIPEFRKLILDEYLVKDAARFVQQAQDPNLKPEQRQDALNMALATGHLKRYLSFQITMGNNAEGALPDLEEALAEARQEDLEGGDTQ